MASGTVTDDYYAILGVETTASSKAIASAYKQMALKLHPDRNPRADATQTFQRLQQAYETLKDEVKRATYDLLYPSIKRATRNPPNTQPQQPPPPSPSDPATPSEQAAIKVLEKARQKRGVDWNASKRTLDSSIFEGERAIRRLEVEIKRLESILAAEKAEEERKNSWSTWFWSPLYPKKEESEDEQARKDRGRQERTIEKDMKERRLRQLQKSLKSDEEKLRFAEESFDRANRRDDAEIQRIRLGIKLREDRKRQEREREEREKREKLWRERQEELQKQARERAEAMRKAEKAREEAVRKERESELRRQQEIFEEMRKKAEQYRESDFKKRNTHRRECHHRGWWPKIQGRASCSRCHQSFGYLLECPGCSMTACASCQGDIRRRNRR